MTTNHSDYDPVDSGAADAAAAGDVSTTGHSSHDVPGHADAHGAAAGHDDHDTHGGHGHGVDTSDVPTLVPTNWRQLVLPAVIILVVGILLIGPVSGAFQSRPVSPTTAEEAGGEGGHGSNAQNEEPGAAGETESEPTATTLAITPTPEPPSTPTTGALKLPSEATRTAVAVAGQSGSVERDPIRLEFAGSTFDVEHGSGLLPDWKPAQPETTAMWIDGTYANHILYVPYTAANENLFKSAKVGDTLKLTMNTGQVFVFEIKRNERALNGPPTEEGQYTVSSAMAQDHAGVTIFLTGDPAADRAVVQADFNGTIQ